MDYSVSTSSGEKAWDIVALNPFASTVLFVLFAYLFVRHFLMMLVMMDVLVSWLRKFSWFPKEGKRLNAIFHWLAAIALFAGFQAIGVHFGWIEYVPK